MQINLQKSVYMCFVRNKTTHVYSYTINSTCLNQTFEHKYLSVYLASDLSWRHHVNYVCAKACRVLGFLRGNAKRFPVKTKELLYKTNVRPILELACTVWDPRIKSDVEKLETVQNFAARFVLKDYSRNFSVSTAKRSLGWDSLQHRKRVLRRKFFHSIFHNKTGIDRSCYLMSPDYVSLRTDHSCRIKEIHRRTELFKHAFFPKTIGEWNKLPKDVVTIMSNDVFSCSCSVSSLNIPGFGLSLCFK